MSVDVAVHAVVEEVVELAAVAAEQAETPPAQEAPPQQAPAEETATEVAPAEETPAEETAVQETPAQEAPAQETPAQEAPAQETPAQEAPAPETAEAPDARKRRRVLDGLVEGCASTMRSAPAPSVFDALAASVGRTRELAQSLDLGDYVAVLDDMQASLVACDKAMRRIKDAPSVGSAELTTSEDE